MQLFFIVAQLYVVSSYAHHLAVKRVNDNFAEGALLFPESYHGAEEEWGSFLEVSEENALII